MFDILFSAENTLFTAALVFSLGLLLIELFMMMMGMSSSLENADTYAPDAEGIDIDAKSYSLDINTSELTATEHLLDSETFAQVQAALGTDGQDTQPQAPTKPGPMGSFLQWTGITAAPLLIWLAIFCFLFSSIGFTLTALLGLVFTPGPWFAGTIALPPTLLLTGTIARTFGRLLPAVESYGSDGRFHGHQGTVSHGAATQTNAAQVVFTDAHKNHRNIMAKALKDETLEQGTTVLLLRDKDGNPRAVRLCANPNQDPPI